MRKKNITRAAVALFESQGDDKNKVLGSFIENKEVRQRVKDQGRALLILERLCLPQGKFSFTKDEIESALFRKLEKKGHRIQDDEEEDDEQFAQEKSQAKVERLAQVDNILGKTLEDLPQEKEEETPAPCHKDEFGLEVDFSEAADLGDTFTVSYELASLAGAQQIPEEVNTEIDLPEIAWQLIGQAYIDGIRAGRESQ